MTPEEQLRQALDLLREIRQLPAFDDGVYISSYGARLVERMDALLAGTAAPTPKKGIPGKAVGSNLPRRSHRGRMER